MKFKLPVLLDNDKKNQTNMLYTDFTSIFGLGIFKYLLLLKGLGNIFLKKVTVNCISSNKLTWIHFFLSNNFVLANKLRLFKVGKILQYISFFNIKRFKLKNNLPVRGQRTQTNAKTCKHIKLIKHKIAI